jgi:pimeloyl-ACP methyl ester carboxylesterase
MLVIFVMKYFLIHGYGVGADYGFWRKKLSKNCGFGAFDKLLLDRQATVFSWGIEKKFNGWQFFNPLAHIRLYLLEQAKACQKETLEKLKLSLEKAQPEIIVAHSMGTFLLLKFLGQNDIPKSVKTIVFVQSNVSYLYPIPKNLLDSLDKNHLKLINLYCPWDTTLPFVLLTNGGIAAGLVGYKHSKIHNKVFPLYKRLNLHTSSINDSDLIRYLERVG